MLQTLHPGSDGLAVEQFEGRGEGAVAAESALLGKFCGGDGRIRTDTFPIEPHEVVYAQAVDIGIVGDALQGEIVAQIGAVGADGCGELLQGDVVPQIGLAGLAVCFQLLLDVDGGGQTHGGRFILLAGVG